MTFRACAPPVSYAPDTDVGRLSLRRLVQLSARLDVADDLAESAAARAVTVATTGDTTALLEMEAALDDVATWSGKCACKEFRSEMQKRDLEKIVRGRLPPPETRTPEHWVEGILTRIDAIRALKRRTAEIVNADAAAPVAAESSAKVAEAERDLCETVHAARAPLGAEAYANMLELVYRTQRQRAGEGSAEVAKQMLDEVKDTSSCE